MSSVYVPVAHIDKNKRSQPLVDHLRGVEFLARSFAGVFGAAECGAAAGRWHDVGKFSGDFQSMIHSANGMEAHIETEGGPRDHSTAGAVLAMRTLDGDLGSALAWCIGGHHAGLADNAALFERLRQKSGLLDGVLKKNPPLEIVQAPSTQIDLPNWLCRGGDDDRALALDHPPEKSRALVGPRICGSRRSRR